MEVVTFPLSFLSLPCILHSPKWGSGDDKRCRRARPPQLGRYGEHGQCSAGDMVNELVLRRVAITAWRSRPWR